jgi:hypothetical protein
VILLKSSVSELRLEADAMTVVAGGSPLSSPPRTPLPGTQLSEMVLWASVYPTSMSSWPASAVAIDRQCKGVSDAVKGALVAEIMRAATASSARSHSGFQSDRRAHMRCSEGVTVRAVANEDGKRS